MDLSRRDALRRAQGTLQATKVNFVLLGKKKNFFLLELAPLTVSRLYVFQCNMATPKHFAYNLATTITR